MKPILLFFIVFALRQTLFAQEYFIRGEVKDKVSNSPLPYANIRVLNSSTGTTTNKSGQYELKLNRGEYKLITSYIGYNSDTISVKLNSSLSEINFSLTQTEINLPAITIRPGVNPALEIIRKAIARKEERNKKLLSYEFEAYTKGIVKTQNDFTASGRQVSLGIGSDTSALKITGILENESKGYYKKPDKYKEIITARKQSSNLPSFVNTLSGGSMVQDLYKDEFNFLGTNLPGPLAKNVLSYYDFYITNTLANDEEKNYFISDFIL